MAHHHSEIVNGNLVLPTGWVMPSFLYDANQLAHCYVGIQKTEETAWSLCQTCRTSCAPSMWTFRKELRLGRWICVEQPLRFLGRPPVAFILERLNESTAEWDWVAEMPDGVFGASYTDNPGPCVQALVYRVRQMAFNGEDEHVSNVANLCGTVGATPVVSHVDVANGLAHVHWDFEPAEETLGYMITSVWATAAGPLWDD